MKEHGILFSAPMVQALLAGTKTQTRRTAINTSRPGIVVLSDFDAKEGLAEIENLHSGVRYWKPCPYGRPGDQLWVREAYRFPCSYDPLPPRSVSDTEGRRFVADEVTGADAGFGKYRPGMFMPRWASRITLEITEVRVERLQDISAADALSEGIKINIDAATRQPLMRITGKFPPALYIKGNGLVIAEYASLWESLNGAGSWTANPWVWAVSFKVIKP